jgi:hypothetical protein
MKNLARQCGSLLLLAFLITLSAPQMKAIGGKGVKSLSLTSLLRGYSM